MEDIKPEAGPSQPKVISRVIFTIDRAQGKIVSVLPAVDSDKELEQLDRWIDACVLMGAFIRPFDADLATGNRAA